MDPRFLDTKLKKTILLEVSQLKSTQKGKNLADIMNRNTK